MSIVSSNENIFYQILNLKSLLSVSSTLPNFVSINLKPTWGTMLSSLAIATTHQICKEKGLFQIIFSILSKLTKPKNVLCQNGEDNSLSS
jgi:hypothetical protein